MFRSRALLPASLPLRATAWNKVSRKSVVPIAAKYFDGRYMGSEDFLVRTIISLPLAGLFVFLAGFNPWIMLTGRGRSPRSRRLLTHAHRICGYTFIALFAIFCYFMLLRVRGSSDELSPRIILHMALAFALAPLLLAKVIVVRYQKAAWGVLIALGLSIFVTAFTLVTLNVSVHYLRNAAPHKVPFSISLRVVAAVIIAAIVALLTRHRQTKSTANTANVSAKEPPDRESTNQLEL